MNIEYRFKVICDSFSVTKNPFVGKISGHRKEVVVSVTRTSVTDFRSRIRVKEWDQMARTDQDAREQWLAWLRRRVERSESDLKERREALSQAEKNSSKYAVRRIQ